MKNTHRNKHIFGENISNTGFLSFPSGAWERQKAFLKDFPVPPETAGEGNREELFRAA